MDKLTGTVLGINNLRLEPLYFHGQDTRKRAIADDNNVLYGIVGRNYKVVSHQSLVSQVQEWLPEGEIVGCATGGMNHSKAIITLALPKVYDLNGEKINVNINVINSLDGTWPMGILVTGIRACCVNQILLLRKQAFINIHEKHLATGIFKLQREMRLVSDVYNILEGQLSIAKKLMDSPCTTAKGIELLDKMLNKKIIAQKTHKKAVELYKNPIREEDTARSLWIAYNSITDVLSQELREKQKTTTFANIERVGKSFCELVD